MQRLLNYLSYNWKKIILLHFKWTIEWIHWAGCSINARYWIAMTFFLKKMKKKIRRKKNDGLKKDHISLVFLSFSVSVSLNFSLALNCLCVNFFLLVFFFLFIRFASFQLKHAINSFSWTWFFLTQVLEEVILNGILTHHFWNRVDSKCSLFSLVIPVFILFGRFAVLFFVVKKKYPLKSVSPKIIYKRKQLFLFCVFFALQFVNSFSVVYMFASSSL